MVVVFLIRFIISFQALKQLDREKIQLATKFGIVKFTADHITVNGAPEYARLCCEASLKRLQVDYIDLYYYHRIDQNVPIEETVGDFTFCCWSFLLLSPHKELISSLLDES